MHGKASHGRASGTHLIDLKVDQLLVVVKEPVVSRAAHGRQQAIFCVAGSLRDLARRLRRRLLATKPRLGPLG